MIKCNNRNIRHNILIIFLLLKRLKFITPFLKFIFIKADPKPTKYQNKGEESELDMAISPYPNLANLIFNIISGKLLPKFNIVIAIKEFGIFIIFAKSFNKDINILQANKIHKIDIKRPNKDKSPICLGSFFGSVILKK